MPHTRRPSTGHRGQAASPPLLWAEGSTDARASDMDQRFAPTGDHFHWNAHDGFGSAVLEPGRFEILDGFERIEGGRRHGVLRDGMATV